jgi:hypothetical protein
LLLVVELRGTRRLLDPLVLERAELAARRRRASLEHVRRLEHPSRVEPKRRAEFEYAESVVAEEPSLRFLALILSLVGGVG